MHTCLSCNTTPSFASEYSSSNCSFFVLDFTGTRGWINWLETSFKAIFSSNLLQTRIVSVTTSLTGWNRVVYFYQTIQFVLSSVRLLAYNHQWLKHVTPNYAYMPLLQYDSFFCFGIFIFQLLFLCPGLNRTSRMNQLAWNQFQSNLFPPIFCKLELCLSPIA